jgi:hypothetical protein
MVKSQNFVARLYVDDGIQKEFRRSWLNKKKYDERTL